MVDWLHANSYVSTRMYQFVLSAPWQLNHIVVFFYQVVTTNAYDWLITYEFVCDFSFFFFFFFLFSFLQPCLHYHNGDFSQILDTATHILVFRPALLCLASWHSFNATQLAVVWWFLGKSLNLREFKTTSNGGNHSRSRHFPFLKPTNSVIPY